jgi:hypothetical protein
VERKRHLKVVGRNRRDLETSKSEEELPQAVHQSPAREAIWRDPLISTPGRKRYFST